jgi:hypothetical protein
MTNVRYLQKKGAGVIQVGNKTECAMLAFVESFGIKYEALRKAANIQKMYLKIYFVKI